MLKKILLGVLIFVLIIVGLGGWMAADFMRNDKIDHLPARPSEDINKNIDQVLYDLEEGNEPNWDIINLR